MSDSTSQILIRLLSTGDLSALVKGKEQSEALKVSLEALKLALGTLGVGLSLGALVEGIESAVEYGANLKHLAEQANISVAALQQLSYAAAGAELNTQDLYGTLNILSRNLAQAADGATKQNRAIAELGLNTAELLAMPVEQQIETIARAYVGATDKTKAWADVTALLGRNSMRARELLEGIGTTGLAGVNVGLTLSEADVERTDKVQATWARMALNWKTAGVDLLLISDTLHQIGSGKGLADVAAKLTLRAHGASTQPKPELTETPAEHDAKVAQINAQLAATIQALPQMVSAHAALTKALAEENKAYEGPAEAAKRLRAQASELESQAAPLAGRKYDAEAQIEAVRLQAQASALRTQANAEDVKGAKELAQYSAAETEMAQKRTQEALKLLPVNQQLSAAGEHKMELEQALASLDIKSLTYNQDHLKLEGEILAVDTQISALKEKDALTYVESMAKEHDLADKREAIAAAAIEHDYNLTDTQKWEQKHELLIQTVSEQEKYIQNMQTLAASDKLPAAARDKAGQLAAQGENALSSTRESLAAQGPDPSSFTANLSKNLIDLNKQWGTLQQNMAHGLTGVISQGFSSVSREISKAILGAQTLGQAFQNIAIDIGETLVQSLVDMGVQWVATEAMKLAFGTTAKAADTATTVAAAEAASLAWAVPAALASVASFGAADVAGMAGLTAAVAESATIGAVGFASGGYTGGVEDEVAGMVHGNEFVWSAPAVRAVGVGNLERAHQAALGGGGGGTAASVAPGRASGNIILAMSPADVAKSQRSHVDARVIRMAGIIPQARYAI